MVVNYKPAANRQLTQQELEDIQKAQQLPAVYDEDCPELTPEMEQAFVQARMAKPLNGEAVTLYLAPETLAKARMISTDYITALGRMLDHAVAEYRLGNS